MIHNGVSHGELFNDRLWQDLVQSISGLRCLRLRLYFQEAGSATPLVLGEPIWRATLKNALAPEVRDQLFPPNAKRGQGHVDPPGLSISAAPVLTLTFFGTADTLALKVVEALTIATATPLAQQDRSNIRNSRRPNVGWLTNIQMQCHSRLWKDIPLPTRSGEPLATGVPLSNLMKEASADASVASSPSDLACNLALHLRSLCLIDAPEPPTLNQVLRALWPRIFATAEAWQHTDLGISRGDLHKACECLPIWAPDTTSQWVPHVWTQRSGRQDAKWTRPGYTGLLLYHDVPLTLARLLQLGQVIGLGQGSTVGLGQYSVLTGPGPS